MSEIILVGDRILVDPEVGERETASGLVLPASVSERDKVRGGRVVRVGPGYLMPNPEFSESETWAPSRDSVRYLPLQARPGDFVYFLRKEAIELTFQNHDYLIVSHGAILAIIREEPEDILEKLDGLEDLGDLPN